MEWDTAANEQKDGTDYFMTSASSVIVTASDNDGSGVASVRYRINGGEERTGLTTGQQISSEGVYEFKVTDNAGNVKVSTIEIVAKPVLTTSPTVSNGQITNKDITVTVTGTSAVIKINGKTPTEIDPSATNDTTYTIKETMNYSIVAEDVFGSKTSLVVISVDKDIPSAPVIAVDNEEPTNGTVDVIITYPSSAKENEKYYKIGLDGDVQRYNGPINLTENKTIYAWYVNTSENQSEQATYTVSNIDTVAPEIVFNTKDSAVSIADEDRAKVTTAKDVVMRVSDEGLGIDRIVYSLNNGSEIQASTETTTLSMRGTYEVTVYDKAGNVTNATLKLLDGPSITTLPAVSNKQTINTDVRITVEGESRSSNPLKLTINGEEKSYPYDTQGNGTYETVVTDAFGRQESLTFTIDKDAPVAPTLSISNAKPTNESIYLKVRYPSNAEKKYFKIGVDGMTKEYDTEATSEGIEITQNCTVIAWYTTTKDDLTVKSAEGVLDITNIDNTNPEIAVTSNENGIKLKNNKTSASSVIVNTQDSGVGIASVTYRYKEKMSDEYAGPYNCSNDINVFSNRGYYKVIAVDAAGNETTKEFLSKIL